MVKKKDFMLIGAVILIAVISLVIMQFFKGNGSKVVIRVNGEVYGTYDLDKDKVIYLDNKGYNTVKIQDGSVSMIEASCPDQICVYSYPLSKDEPGAIICLPHDVAVEIE